MKTTGIFQTAQYVFSLDTPDYQLVPFGDVHFLAPLHATDAFDKWIESVSSLPNPVFIGIGDYTDLLSTSERKVLDGNLHDSTNATLNDYFISCMDEFYTKIEFMKGRCAGLLCGNHMTYLRFGSKTISSTEYLCGRLGCKYLGVSAIVRLAAKFNSKTSSVIVCAHHGRGGGRTLSSGLNPVVQMANSVPGGDIFLQGHSHHRMVVPDQGLQYCGPGRIVDRERWMARCGSFLKAYEPGEASYIVDIAGHPSSIGGIKFDINVSGRVPKILGGYV